MHHFSFTWSCLRTDKTGTVNVSMPDTDEPMVDICDDAEEKAWEIIAGKLGHNDFQLLWEYL